MRSALFFFYLLFAICPIQSQTIFQKAYGKTPQDYAYSMQKTFDGGFIISGISNSFGGSGYLYLLKTDANGDTAWVKGYTTAQVNYGFSVRQTTDSGYLVTGYSGVLKTDKLGNIVWFNNYIGANFYSAIETTDGGFIMAGSFGSSGSSNGLDVFILKTNNLGVKLWSKKLGADIDEYCACIRQTSDGGYIASGFTDSFGAGSWDVYLLKLNSSGDTLWTRTFGGAGYEGGSGNIKNSLELTSDGGYIIGATTTSFGAGSSDAYLLKTDANGNLQWSKTYGGTSLEQLLNVKPTSDGGYIFTGLTNSFGAGQTDIYLVKTNSLGDTLWTRAFGGALNDYAESVEQTNDKGFAIIGYTNNFGNGNYDIILIKTDSSGNSTCNQFNTTTQITTPATITGQTATQTIFVTLNIGNVFPSVKRGINSTDGCTPNDIHTLNEKNHLLHIFPNPCDGIFTLSINNNFSSKIKISISISNLLGEVVYSGEQENNALINLQNTSCGTYILKAEIENKIYIQKIVINR